LGDSKTRQDSGRKKSTKNVHNEVAGLADDLKNEEKDFVVKGSPGLDNNSKRKTSNKKSPSK